MKSTMEDLDNMSDIGWEADYKEPEEREQDSNYPGPKDNPRPRIPEDVYEAVCFKTEESSFREKEKRLYVHYRIISGEFEGVELYQTFNFIYKYSKGGFPRGSKYYKEWSKANRSLPDRNDKMTPRVFKNNVFKVKVRFTNPKEDDGSAMDDIFRYSVVDIIIEVLT